MVLYLPNRASPHSFNRALSLVDLQRRSADRVRTAISISSSPPLNVTGRAPSPIPRRLLLFPLFFPPTTVNACSGESHEALKFPAGTALHLLHHRHEERHNLKISVVILLGLAQLVFDFGLGLDLLYKRSRSSSKNVKLARPSPTHQRPLVLLFATSGDSADELSLRVTSISGLSLIHTAKSIVNVSSFRVFSIPVYLVLHELVIIIMKRLNFNHTVSEGFLTLTMLISILHLCFSFCEGFLSMLKEKQSSSFMERKTTLNFLTCFASCVTVYTGPEDSIGFISMNAVGDSLSITSHLKVTNSQHFSFVIIVQMMHLSLASNLLSIYLQFLSILVLVVILLYCFDRRGRIIPSDCNPD